MLDVHANTVSCSMFDVLVQVEANVRCLGQMLTILFYLMIWPGEGMTHMQFNVNAAGQHRHM